MFYKNCECTPKENCTIYADFISRGEYRQCWIDILKCEEGVISPYHRFLKQNNRKIFNFTKKSRKSINILPRTICEYNNFVCEYEYKSLRVRVRHSRVKGYIFTRTRTRTRISLYSHSQLIVTEHVSGTVSPSLQFFALILKHFVNKNDAVKILIQ